MQNRSRHLHWYRDSVSEPVKISHRKLASEPSQVSRKTRCAVGFAVWLLPRADRARYRVEFAAELADTPRCDQASYAARQARRAWATRRSLKGMPSVWPTRVVVVFGSGACSAAYLARLGWPAAFLGSVFTIALMWVISSHARTGRLASLIRAARKR